MISVAACVFVRNDKPLAPQTVRLADGPETTRARIAGRLLQMDESFREMLPFVFDLFGVPDPANCSPASIARGPQKEYYNLINFE